MGDPRSKRADSGPVTGLPAGGGRSICWSASLILQLSSPDMAKILPLTLELYSIETLTLITVILNTRSEIVTFTYL